MRSLSVGAAREDLAETVSRVASGSERVELTQDDKPIAAIISSKDLELLEMLEDRVDLEAALATEEEETVSLEDLKAMLRL